MERSNLGPAGTSDATYERYARLVSTSLEVPVALVSFVSDVGQVFPGSIGLSEPWASHRGTPLTHSYCQYVVARDQPLVVTDTREVPELRESLAIKDLDVIAYAGFPLHDNEDRAVGALCAIDSTPRVWSEKELSLLEDLAAACTTEIRLRGESDRASRARENADRRDDHSRRLLALSDGFLGSVLVSDVMDAITRAVSLVVGGHRTSIGLVSDDATALVWRVRGDVAGVPEDVWQHMSLDDEQFPAVWAFRRREPLFLEDAPAAIERFPILGTMGIPGGGCVALPLVTPTASLGVIFIRWLGSALLDDDMREILATLAGYAALALERAQLLQDRRDVASVLQSAMITTLPELPGLTLDAVYSPAGVDEQVGGDWYDVLEGQDGSVSLVVGDVTGHDIAAASLMGQVRSTLRTLVWEHDEQPSGILRRLDAALGGTGVEVVATAVLARLSPPREDASRILSWSLAGHPAPLLWRADGSAAYVESKPGLPVGLGSDRERIDCSMEIYPGDSLVLFSDGLVERRDTPLWDRLEDLRLAVADHGPENSENLLNRMVPESEREDDVVVLTVTVGTDGAPPTVE